MGSTFFKWLAENNFLAFMILLLVIASVVVTIAIMKFYRRFKNAEESCKDIPTLKTNISQSINIANSIEKKLDETFLPKITSLDKSVHGLITFLSTKHTDIQAVLFVSKSPMQLTEIGEAILQQSGGKNYIDTNLDALLEIMTKQEFKSALDVQNFAVTLLIRESNSDGLTPIKNYLFQSPVYKAKDSDIPLDMALLSNVIGIYLRNKYFEKYPDLENVE
jgi:hypothetical protein